ncbi:hypothetical protein [Ancylobacter sp. SL191]|jgi:pilus assembly protein Flp/PilA|uniref:hypothetical protein n=1 Tax=Ancylobacter sp. SL191 TaxID=2995166 RepID=UPI002271714F|nr:hypothetical protein [Ancylobacter sp. SL191]WAC27776.1 hypothetical protein OU996_01460 [Ancylobacter sp. SL191]
MRELVDRELIGRDMRRRAAVARRGHSTGLEYGLIAAALAIAIVTVVAGLSARYGGEANAAATMTVDRAAR